MSARSKKGGHNLSRPFRMCGWGTQHRHVRIILEGPGAEHGSKGGGGSENSNLFNSQSKILENRPHRKQNHSSDSLAPLKKFWIHVWCMHDDNHFPGDIRSLGIMGEFVCLSGIIGSKQITAIIMHESYFFFGKGGG